MTAAHILEVVAGIAALQLAVCFWLARIDHRLHELDGVNREALQAWVIDRKDRCTDAPIDQHETEGGAA